MCALLLMSAGALAQSVLDAQHLLYVKQHLSDPSYAQAYKALKKQAEYDLVMKPGSICLAGPDEAQWFALYDAGWYF